MIDSPPMWLMGLVATSMFIHGFLTIMMVVEIKRMSDQITRISSNTKHTMAMCETAIHRAADCNTGLDRIDNSLSELVEEIHENVFRLMWQEDMNRGRRNRS